MTIKLSNAYLSRQILNASGTFDVPVSWDIQLQDGGWITYAKPNGDVFASYKMNEKAGEGLFVIFGDKEFLDQQASGSATIMPAKEAWRRKAEPAVLQTLRYWREWVISGILKYDDGVGGFVTSSVVSQSVTLCTWGNNIPDPTVNALPWNLDKDGTIVSRASASVRITALHQPSLGATLAGIGCDGAFRDEPDRG